MHWIAVEGNPLGYQKQVEVSDSDLHILVDTKVSMGQEGSIGGDKASKNSVS